MKIQQLLEKLAELQQRGAAGEDVSAEVAQARGELEQIKAAAASAAPTGGLTAAERTELENLRKSQQESSERAIAQKLVDEVAVKLATDTTAQQARIETYAAEAITKAFGGETDIKSVIENVMREHRGGSRFPSPNASDQVLDALAAGATINEQGQLVTADSKAPFGAARVGEHKGVKEIEDGKNLAQLLSILGRSKALGPIGLTEAEQQFLAKQFIGVDAEGKAMAQGTGSAGGLLIPEQWMPDILTPIRAQAVVRRANPRIVPFDKQMNQISVSSGATAFYTAENARITPSEMTVGQSALLTPKFLTALVPVSNVLLNNWSNGDSFVRDDMTSAITTREDLSFIMGTGSGGEPIGFREISGRITNPLTPGANGFVPTLPQLRMIKGRTRLLGQPNPRWTWFFHPSILTYLETLVDTTGRFLVDTNLLKINDDGVSGTFDGFPFFCSYQIPINLTLGTSTNITFLMLVDMQEALVGEEQQLALAVSDQATYSPDGGTTNISAFQQNQTVFRAIMGHDVAHRRPGTGLIVQEGVKTA